MFPYHNYVMSKAISPSRSVSPALAIAHYAINGVGIHREVIAIILRLNKREQFLPLLVVFISTIDKEGNRNITPYANVMPILSPLNFVAIASWLRRDTLDNIRGMKKFVINVPSADLVDEVMICSRKYPGDVDEFAEANLRAKASQKVIAPSIKGCIAWMKCMLDRAVTEEGKYSTSSERSYISRSMIDISQKTGIWILREHVLYW